MKYDSLLKDGFKLDKVQEEGVDFILEKEWCIIADEQGVGKTLQALIPAFLYNLRTVIVVPSSLKKNWEDEIHKFSKHKLNVKVIYKGKDIETIDFEEDIIIVSYTLAQKMKLQMSMADYWILDECHKIKAWHSAVTRFFRSIATMVKPKLMVMQSGTPVTKTPADWLSYLYIASLSPKPTNGIRVHSKFKGYEHFENTICEFKEGKGIHRNLSRVRRKLPRRKNRFKKERVYVGVREENLWRLEEIKEGKVLRRLAKDVQTLPDFYWEYTQIADSINKEVEEHFASFEGGEYEPHIMEYKSLSAYKKTVHTVNYCIEKFSMTDRKVVIFTDHPGPAEELYLKLTKKGFKVGKITGKTSESFRQKYVDSFKRGELDYIVLTIGTSSAGLNLTISQDVVFNDYSWRSIDIEQAVKRIHRKGQDKRCTFHVICSDASDRLIFNKVNQKKKDIELVV